MTRYCDNCGAEQPGTAEAEHCGRPMLLVDGIHVIEERGIRDRGNALHDAIRLTRLLNETLAQGS